MYSSTCAPVVNNVTLGYGENHDFNLLFQTAIDLTAATCTFTVRRNNSDDIVLLTANSPITNKSVNFHITPEQSRTLGAGIFYYDIWMMNGVDFEKPIVTGTLTVNQLTTRVQP